MNSGLPQDLQRDIESLAFTLEAPRVAGELEGWAAAVREAATPLSELLRRRIQVGHRVEYAKIVETDPELAPRVDQLRQADCEVLQQFESLFRRVERLETRSRHLEPNEGALKDDVESLVDDGLAFILRVHKQEIALRTWLQEAFNRDSGAGD